MGAYTGSGNIFKDAHLALIDLIKKNVSTLGIQDVFDDDLQQGNPNTVVVEFMGHTEKYNTIGKKNVSFDLRLRFNIFYYYREVDKGIKKSEIRDKTDAICRLIRGNSDLDGITGMGLEINSTRIISRLRSNGLVSGSVIDVIVPIFERYNRTQS